ncbi:unnamed protein product [Pleuronectes platessa]|uniref:Uncharacterized protein n=1 Tax=Pleuronectes platessa TaxID=8262 RepID=A0A9N7VWW8_PLEPL|nr:unnamed protein product [Pleuronectes platessa]
MFIFVVKPLGTCRGWGSSRSVALLSAPPEAQCAAPGGPHPVAPHGAGAEGGEGTGYASRCRRPPYPVPSNRSPPSAAPTDTAPRHTIRKAPAPRMSTSPPKKTSRRAAHRASGGVVRRATGRLLSQPQDVPSGTTRANLPACLSSQDRLPGLYQPPASKLSVSALH